MDTFDESNRTVVAAGVFCAIANGTVMVSSGIRNSVSRSKVSSSGRETTTMAPLVTPAAVAKTTADPFALPATRPAASTVATVDGLMLHDTGPGS